MLQNLQSNVIWNRQMVTFHETTFVNNIDDHSRFNTLIRLGHKHSLMYMLIMMMVTSKQCRNLQNWCDHGE